MPQIPILREHPSGKQKPIPKIKKSSCGNIWDYLIQFLLPPVLILWIFILFFQFIDAIIKRDFTSYAIYSQITLMLFGFTLLGNILGSTRQFKPDNEDIKRLTEINIGFLLSTIGFIMTYGGQEIFWMNTDAENLLSTAILIIFVTGSYSIGILFMVVSIFKLYLLLRGIYKKFNITSPK